MGKLAVFVERYTISASAELEALLRFRAAADEAGHEVHFLFRPELRKIPRYDALLIRALTDPLNSSFVAARLAEMSGMPVIDDSRSILICCDKIHMYRRLVAAGVAIPRTVLLSADDVTRARGAALLEELGPQVVLKAPSSSFSSHVEKVRSPEEFEKVGDRFLHRADRLVAQEFVRSSFDWRVGVLAGEPLYTCRYEIPTETFKILATIDGRTVVGGVTAVPVDDCPREVVALGVAAANAIGDGLYGVDLKQTDDGRVVVIEVNDNPTINAEQEDRHAPDVYARIVRHLLERAAVPAEQAGARA